MNQPSLLHLADDTEGSYDDETGDQIMQSKFENNTHKENETKIVIKSASVKTVAKKRVLAPKLVPRSRFDQAVNPRRIKAE